MDSAEVSARPASTDRWLDLATRAAVLLLLALSCFFIWRISMVALRVEQTIRENATDVKQITSTAAGISRQVDRIGERVERLEQKAADVLRVNEVESLLDEAARVRRGVENPKVRTPMAEQEIAHLLSRLRWAGARFEYGGQERSTYSFYLQLYAKYQIQKGSIATAEEFIESVGTKTVTGETYFVFPAGGGKRQLSAWLADELKAFRSKPAAEPGPSR